MDDLLRLAPPPPVVAHPPDWSLVADRFPDEARRVVDVYGAGCFDGFLWLFSPGHPNRYMELGIRQAESRWARKVLGEAAPGALLCWGTTDNGDVGWMEPGTGRVWIAESRGPAWHGYDGGLVAFLAAWLSGTERVSVFPDEGLAPTTPRFRPAAA